MGMQLPDWAREIFLIATGDGWPKADEDALWALSQEWAGISGAVYDLESRIVEPVRAVRRTNWDGPASEAFAAAGDGLMGGGGPQLSGLAAGSQELADFIYETGVNVQYMKIIVIEELVILAAQIAYLIAMSPWTFGASAAAVPALEALGKFFAQSVVRQLILSILSGQVLQIGLDAIDQLLQMALGVRKRWDVELTKNATITGAVGSALGPLLHGLGRQLGKDLQHLVGKRVAEGLETVATNATHEYTTSGFTGVVTGKGWTGTPWDLTAGTTDGAADALRHRHRHGTAPHAPSIDVPDQKVHPDKTQDDLPGKLPWLPTPAGPSPNAGTGSAPTTTDGQSAPLLRAHPMQTWPAPSHKVIVPPPRTGTAEAFDVDQHGGLRRLAAGPTANSTNPADQASTMITFTTDGSQTVDPHRPMELPTLYANGRGHVHMGRVYLHSAGRKFAGKPVTIRLDDAGLHAIVDGTTVNTTHPSAIPPEQFATLSGARNSNGPLPLSLVDRTKPLQVDRKVSVVGDTKVAGVKIPVGLKYARENVTLHLADGVASVIHQGRTIRQHHLEPAEAELFAGARDVYSATAPPPPPAVDRTKTLQVTRKVGADGRVKVNETGLRVGKDYAGQMVTLRLDGNEVSIIHQRGVTIERRHLDPEKTQLFAAARDAQNITELPRQPARDPTTTAPPGHTGASDALVRRSASLPGVRHTLDGPPQPAEVGSTPVQPDHAPQPRHHLGARGSAAGVDPQADPRRVGQILRGVNVDSPTAPGAGMSPLQRHMLGHVESFLLDSPDSDATPQDQVDAGAGVATYVDQPIMEQVLASDNWLTPAIPPGIPHTPDTVTIGQSAPATHSGIAAERYPVEDPAPTTAHAPGAAASQALQQHDTDDTPQWGTTGQPSWVQAGQPVAPLPPQQARADEMTAFISGPFTETQHLIQQLAGPIHAYDPALFYDADTLHAQVAHAARDWYLATHEHEQPGHSHTALHQRLTSLARQLQALRQRVDLVADLCRQQLVIADVPRDGDCLYTSLIVADPYLAALTGGSVHAMRAYAADLLWDAFHTSEAWAAPLLPTVSYTDATPHEVQQWEWAHEVAEPGQWAGQAGDWTPWLLAEAYGVALQVVQPHAIVHFGHNSPTPITLLRQGDHYLATLPANGQLLPGIDHAPPRIPSTHLPANLLTVWEQHLRHLIDRYHAALTHAPDNQITQITHAASHSLRAVYQAVHAAGTSQAPDYNHPTWRHALRQAYLNLNALISSADALSPENPTGTHTVSTQWSTTQRVSVTSRSHSDPPDPARRAHPAQLTSQLTPALPDPNTSHETDLGPDPHDETNPAPDEQWVDEVLRTPEDTDSEPHELAVIEHENPLDRSNVRDPRPLTRDSTDAGGYASVHSGQTITPKTTATSSGKKRPHRLRPASKSAPQHQRTSSSDIDPTKPMSFATKAGHDGLVYVGDETFNTALRRNAAVTVRLIGRILHIISGGDTINTIDPSPIPPEQFATLPRVRAAIDPSKPMQLHTHYDARGRIRLGHRTQLKWVNKSAQRANQQVTILYQDGQLFLIDPETQQIKKIGNKFTAEQFADLPRVHNAAAIDVAAPVGTDHTTHDPAGTVAHATAPRRPSKRKRPHALPSEATRQRRPTTSPDIDPTKPLTLTTRAVKGGEIYVADKTVPTALPLGTIVTVRLDGPILRLIAHGEAIKTIDPSPIPPEQFAILPGAQNAIDPSRPMQLHGRYDAEGQLYVTEAYRARRYVHRSRERAECDVTILYQDGQLFLINPETQQILRIANKFTAEQFAGIPRARNTPPIDVAESVGPSRRSRIVSPPEPHSPGSRNA